LKKRSLEDTSPKTSKFQLKQAQKQATCKSSKKNATPQKNAQVHGENDRVGNTAR